MRPSDVHKRGVSFGHIRRTSTASGLTSQDSTQIATPATPQLPDSIKERRGVKMSSSLNVSTPSPTAHLQQMVRSRKDKALALETPRIKVRKPIDTPTQNMRSDIRKHSVELEKACQEAFFRDSVGSSLTAQTSLSENASPYDTPPSSVSRKSAMFNKLPSLPATRPLPDLPKDTPNTYLQRTLGEAREKLAAYRAGGEDNTARFDEVMKMLETILPDTGTPEKRLVSAPEARTPDHLGGYMPIISEESDRRSSKDGTGNWRSVTAPTPLDRRNERRPERLPEDKTIRMVPASSPVTVAPLNVRKRSTSSDDDLQTPVQRLNVRTSNERLDRKRSIEPIAILEPIEEDSILQNPSAVRKKKSWFGLARRTPEPDFAPARPEASTETVDLGDPSAKRSSYVLSKLQKPLPQDPPVSALSSDFPIRKKRFGGGKKGFSKWLGMKGMDKHDGDDTTGKPEFTQVRTLRMNANARTTVMTNVGNTSLNSLFSASPSPSLDSAVNATSSSGPERSWFARFLNIKPASKLLCFSIPRGRARQELVLLLKAWQRHGVRDLEYSREHNSIYARVDKNNTLNLKPVAFRVELFVVLEHGVKVGLSIARFVQVKGAASGFRGVIEVIDEVMRKRKWLVEDEEKVKALCEVVGG
jgi:hypothetical protein